MEDLNYHLRFEDNFMKIPLSNRVYADFECINQPTNHPRVSFKQIPNAERIYLISPFRNWYHSYFGGSFVTWIVNEILTFEKLLGTILKQI